MIGPNGSQRLALYEQMVLLRQFELAAQKNCKAGRLTGFLNLDVGEEAVAVGVCAHLRRTDWITTAHRGCGHALAKGMSAKSLLAELYGKATGCSGGRGGSVHLCDAKVGVLGANSFVGTALPSAVGVGISAKVRGTDQIAVTFFGDDATSHGAFHEALHFAAARQAPVVFICENNVCATGPSLALATKNPADIASRAVSYGIPGVVVDGNDLLAVWAAAGEAVGRARSGGGPTLIEARTYRTAGHHEDESAGGVHRTQQQLDAWNQRCPILRFRKSLLDDGHASEPQVAEIESWMVTQMQEAVAFAEASPLPESASANENAWADAMGSVAELSPQTTKLIELSWLEAVRDGIAEAMRRDPHLIYFGEGVGEGEGHFGHTTGLWKEFGGKRVIDSPNCSVGLAGASVGAAATGCGGVADLMIADSFFETAGQIIEQAAKLGYLSNGQLQTPVVVRACMGAMQPSGPQPRGAYHTIWSQCPGLLVAVPSNPADAKGLMKTALCASTPVVFIEHRALFSLKGPVPLGDHFVPFGQASVVLEGADLTIVTCGELVQRSLESARLLAAEGVFCEVIDLRTIVPLDVETILTSVAKTRHLLVVDEAFAMCGLGAEIAAVVMEQAFDKLAAPIGRLHPDPIPQAFSAPLADATSVTVDKIVRAAKAVRAGQPLVAHRARTRAARSSAAVESLATLLTPIQREVSVSLVELSASEMAILMPHQDRTVTEATVIRWLKQIGDPVEAGEAIVEVETEKAVTPVESPTTGKLAAIEVRQGEVVKMGQPLGRVTVWAGPDRIRRV